jgi:hypothetical protein
MSKKRLQVILTDEAWSAVESVTKDATEKFESGSINYSDVINEMILTAKVDVKALQLKHTDLRRSLKVLAGKDDIDIEMAIKSLMELKARGGSSKKKASATQEEMY